MISSPCLSSWKLRASALVPAGALLLAGCDSPQITVYQAPKDLAAAPASPSPSSSSGAPGTPAERPKIAFQAPAAWRDLGGDQMNVARLSVQTPQGSAGVNITPLAGMKGQEPLLVNMWRGALRQPELLPEQAEAALRPVEIGSEKGFLFEVAGNSSNGEPVAIVTAFVHRGDKSWFFKLQGDPPVVESQRETFVEFLKTVRFDEPGAPAPATPAPAPALAEDETPAPAPAQEPEKAPEAPAPAPETETPAFPVPAAEPESAPASPERPAAPAAPLPEGFQDAEPRAASEIPGVPPADWTPLPPGPMQAAKFTLPEVDGGKAEVAVSVFNSETGGVPSNVHRWRTQLGMPPGDEAAILADVQKLEGGPEGSVFVALEHEGRGLTGAIVPRGGRWFFYKMTGDAAAVRAARDSFLNFAKTPQ